MRPLLRYLLPLLLAALLAGCTGTRSNRAPTLLLIGYSEGGQGRLAVVQDTFLTDEAVAGRFLFLTSVALPAGELPVAYDVSDRNGLRDELVVLSRAGTSGDASLSVYPIGALEADPNALELAPRLELAYGALEPPDPDTPLEACPTLVQASSSGRYLAVMHDLSLCDSGNLNAALDLIDLEASPPAIVRRFENTSIVPGALFMQQLEGGDRLYYFSDEAGGARLRRVSFPTLEEEASSAIIEGSFRDSDTELRDLELIGGELIALQANRFHAIADPSSADPTVAEEVTTTANSRQLIPTNSTLPTVMILGTSRFTVHRDSRDASPGVTDLSAVDGSLEPVGGFVYFVADSSNNLPLFDLREYLDADQAEPRNYLGTSFGVGQLADPVFVTWAQSVFRPEEGD